MSLKERILEDLKGALKSGDKERLGVLRMLKARILEAEVELRSKKGRDYQLNDAETTDVLAQYGKQRKQSIDSYRAAGRTDLAEREERELAIVQEYLPEQLSEEELRKIIRATIRECGASGPQQMGEVMKRVMPQVQGAAGRKRVSELVKEELS